jgi:hypothetical protein
MEFFPFHGIIAPINRVSRYLGGGFKGVMNQNIETITYAVSIIFKAAIVAAKYAGRVRKRSLQRLAAMDIDEKDKEILFLKDKLFLLETQNAILLKRVTPFEKGCSYSGI